MKKVLFIDDEHGWHRNWRLGGPMGAIGLNDLVEYLEARTIEDAKKLFGENKDVALIVIDACVDDNRPDTIPLVQEFRKTFSGPMIAASSQNGYNDDLLRAGCDHSQNGKYGVSKLVIELLEIEVA